MADSVKTIQLQGINHHVDTIGVQDGMCEDLVNLRFKDGSWRTSGDGQHVYTMQKVGGKAKYSQLFIHTNVYRHLLGVYNGKLYWFANLTPKAENASVEHEAFDFEELTNPVELCDVVGDVSYVRNGHIVVVVDESGDFRYIIYKGKTNLYREITDFRSDKNKFYDGITPYGFVRFHPVQSMNVNRAHKELSDSVWGNNSHVSRERVKSVVPHSTFVDEIKLALDKCVSNNKFVHPFLACVAVELYDGTYALASSPVLVHPGEVTNLGYGIKGVSGEFIGGNSGSCSYMCKVGGISQYPSGSTDSSYITQNSTVVFADTQGGSSSYANYSISVNESLVPTSWAGIFTIKGGLGYIAAGASGYNLHLDIENTDFLVNNRDIFNAICVFITNPTTLFDLDDTDSSSYSICEYKYGENKDNLAAHIGYNPERRDMDSIINELMSSPFFLLKRFAPNESVNGLIKIEDGVLKNIATQDRLQSDCFNRVEYTPKAMLSYNGRPHFANYNARLYAGYPFCQFYDQDTPIASLEEAQLGNKDYYTKVNGSDNNVQEQLYWLCVHKGRSLAQIRVHIGSGDDEKIVSRIITTDTYNARDFEFKVGMLPSLLTYPDSRATKLEILFVKLSEKIIEQIDGYDYAGNSKYVVYKKEFSLKASQYYNFAYYMEGNLMPIGLEGESYRIPMKTVIGKYGSQILMKNYQDWPSIPTDDITIESYPNGLKVSKTDNPFIFPSKYTYQIGSSEIVAMMSNTKAVGTGQSGAAPLVVFTKDGIYRLYVDSSGEMAYTNSRPGPNDVCNDAKSVTRTDLGIVFSTDRGLMLDNGGEECVELGQPLEGDYEDISKDTITKNAYTMQKLAGLPDESMCSTDFLHYLKHSIICNDHNERELLVSNVLKYKHTTDASKKGTIEGDVLYTDDSTKDGKNVYPYTYVLEQDGEQFHWSRRDYTADEYVSNYPTAYRVKDGEMYQVDNDLNCDNGFFLLTRSIKLDTIGFKSVDRFVARGYFETTNEQSTTDDDGKRYIGIYVWGSYDGRKWALLGGNEKTGKFTDIGCVVSHPDCRYFRVAVSGKATKDSRFDFFEVSSKASKLSNKIR